MSAAVDNQGPAPRQRTGQPAVTGLLLVCVLLAMGLTLVALLNLRAARLGARDMLYGQATQVVSSYFQAARSGHGRPDGARLRRLAGEMSSADLTLTVFENLPGDGGGPLTADMMSSLRREGEVVRTVTVSTERMLELWFPMGQGRGRGLGRGRHHGRLKRGRAQGLHGQDGRMLRVRVPLSRADSLVGPARTALAMSGAASLALLALGLLLYRWAARARKAEESLQRQRSLSALGEMAAVMAHEIRTPLASIKGNSQLIGESFPDDPRALAVVQEAARMERLVNGMLDFARPPDPHLAPCDPDQILTRAAGLVAPRAAARGVSLITEPSGRAEPLRADEDQLLQALVNLLNNAIEATPADAPAVGAVVTIGVTNQGREVVYQVQDRGAGLAGAELATLARPFHSGNGGSGGSGLGLSVTRRVVEGHGGVLTLAEREGGGAVARVHLPRGGPRERSR